MRNSEGDRKIFISYSRADEARVEEYVRAIQASGLDAWIDRDEAKHGSLVEQLERGLAESPYALIFFSKSYADGGWTRAEKDVIVKRAVEGASQSVFVVRLDDTELTPFLDRLLWWHDDDPQAFAVELRAAVSGEAPREQGDAPVRSRAPALEPVDLGGETIEELAREAVNLIERRARLGGGPATFDLRVKGEGTLRVSVDVLDVPEGSIADLRALLEICHTHRAFIRDIDEQLPMVVGPDKAAWSLSRDKRATALEKTRAEIRDYLALLKPQIRRS